MRASSYIAASAALALAIATPSSAHAQFQVEQGGYAHADSDVTALVGRLSLDRYKATIKGLTNFGDRRQGTKRNRDAVDWIEAQLKSYGCSDVQRLTYTYEAPAPRPRPTGAPGAARGRRDAFNPRIDAARQPVGAEGVGRGPHRTARCVAGRRARPHQTHGSRNSTCGLRARVGRTRAADSTDGR